MKIAILSYYSGQVDRGVETWAKNLKEKLPNKFDVDILGGDRPALNFFEKFFYFSLHFFSHIAHIRSADIVIPTNGSIQTFICRIVTWLLAKPMIVFGHAGPGADDKWNLLCSPNIFVVFSNSQKKWVEKYKLPWTRVVVIPHAVDTTRFTPARKKPGKNIILCVAANIPSKRVNLVEMAVKKLTGYQFIAVGKGNPVEVSHAEMPVIYQKADVFCFVPWEREAFGLVFLEALASNLPVVTIDDDVRREIVGDSGIFVKNPENVLEIAGAMKKAREKNWGDEPRRQAEKFGWDKIEKKYENLFMNLVQ
ncbi:hypothetical protein A2803_03820 [Candidatus Woesebacteria bacterium RIFCSPHIGHO2_01_FULL_44_21]|uniref:Glycosyl transferase family 1 domain-containing protein n=1 Tax=Candidatus Woesebacteria bacterium RIFCSPHIGHO2_01_FULL_44_21 TaxID=1802503 RepID=A0A1F7YVE0_9BACT|nr:MAG: hypothetical protein A2803_03820 [Candidatus Woesebacteria bacterium RIFCSPHIGHO2_01_FULL_44_21]